MAKKVAKTSPPASASAASSSSTTSSSTSSSRVPMAAGAALLLAVFAVAAVGLFPSSDGASSIVGRALAVGAAAVGLPAAPSAELAIRVAPNGASAASQLVVPVVFNTTAHSLSRLLDVAAEKILFDDEVTTASVWVCVA